MGASGFVSEEQALSRPALTPCVCLPCGRHLGCRTCVSTGKGSMAISPRCCGKSFLVGEDRRVAISQDHESLETGISGQTFRAAPCVCGEHGDLVLVEGLTSSQKFL